MRHAGNEQGIPSSTISAVAPGASFPRLFEARAAENPEGVAISFDGRLVTYRELNARANRWARQMLNAGIGRGSVVAGVLERSTELVVFVLAALKAGACCLPTDSEYPAERLRLILDDAEPALLICNRPIMTGVSTIDIRCDVGSELSVENPDVPLRESDPSFLVYTSGSTGRPKGVVMTHGGRARRQIWTQIRYRANESDRHLLKAPVGFGTLIREMFWPLTTGGRIVIAKRGGHRDVDYLCRLIRQEGVSIANFVPSLLREFIEHPQVALCTSLRHVFSTGEALSSAVATRFLDRLSRAKLHLFYGSSEAPTATYHDFEGPTANSIPTIGYPADVPVYVLDDERKPVREGVSGEIFIGGNGLASGYYRQPELTTERFVPDPFSTDEHARLFRTGDLGRWEQDGRLTYVGRADEQVKIRGCRVELAEVASAIRALDGVTDVAVIACDGPADAKQIVAFYVSQCQLEAEALRTNLERTLPWFMIPSRFIALERLPPDAHGKVDHTALRAQAESYIGAEITSASLADTEDRQVIEIWRRILKRDSVRADDSFFELGGDSILALRTIAAIRELSGVQIPLEQFFAVPTPKRIAEILRTRTTSADHAPPSPRSYSSVAPLSSAQRRLWFLEASANAGRAYNVCVAYRLGSNLNLSALEDKVNRILAEQEALRCRIELIDGELHQTFPQVAPIRVPVQGGEDLSDWLTAFSRQHLPLDTPPHLKACVYRHGGSEHVLALVLPHFACDRRSIRILEKTLFGSEAVKSGSYSSFCYEEQAWLASDTAKEAVESWKTQLENCAETAEIPGMLPLAEAVNGKGYFSADTVTRFLPDELMIRLEQTAAQEGCTLFTIIWVALAILVGRLARSNDVVLGVPVDGRRSAVHDGTIGNFINIVPLRLRIGDLPVRELLGTAKSVLAHALSNASVPFEQIVEHVKPSRRAGRNPLFEISLNFDPTPKDLLTCEFAMPARLDVPAIDAKFDLNFYFSRSDGRWRVKLVYRSVLYQPQWATALLDSYRELLEQAVLNPDLPAAEYSMVSRSFRELLPDLTKRIEVPEQERVWTAFARSASSTPDATAIDCRSVAQPHAPVMTYAELVTAANRLADQFAAAGVRRGECIAIQTRPTPALVIGILASWRIEAACLLLDERLPEKRRRAMLNQSPVKWLWRPAAGTLSTVPSTGVAMAQAWRHETPACIFFTSGSSGSPNAVCFTHQGISHFLNWERSTLDFTARDRVPLLLSMSFDAVLRDIFLPLTSGATLCLPPENVTPEWIREAQITVLHLVPTLATAWIGARIRPIALDHLRWAVFSGEPLTGSLVQRWWESFGDKAQLMNLYGPTETTMCKCFYVVPKDIGSGVLPVGRPMRDTQVLVMSDAGKPCGVGEQGEIVIRTPFRTMGYLNAPDLQRAKFVGNAQRANDPDDLLYRTGDLGRFRHDGVLEILGRQDRQVKIRGARVEPQEIEGLIAARSEIARCAVIAPLGINGDRYLIAYVVPIAGRELLLPDLIEYLREHLPPYSIPSLFRIVESLPTTPTGKIDYQALAAVQDEQKERQRAITHASSPLELQLTRVWEELLVVSPIGVDDDFFDLGGHSLLALQLIAHIERSLGQALPLSALFPTATIRHLAKQLSQHVLPGAWDPLVTIQHGANKRSYLYCVHPAGGSVFCYVNLARCLGTDQPVWGFQGVDPRIGGEPPDSVEAMASEYVARLQREQHQGSYFLAGFSFGGLIAYEMAQQLHRDGKDVTLLILIDSSFPRSEEIRSDGGLVHQLYNALAKHNFADRQVDEDDHVLWGELTEIARMYTKTTPLTVGSPRHVRGALGLAQTCFREYGLLPTGADLSYRDLRRYLRFLKKNLQVSRDYRLTPVSAPVLFVGASECMPGEEGLSDRAEPWRPLCQGGFEMLEAPGNHVSLLSSPGVNVIADRLNHLLRSYP